MRGGFPTSVVGRSPGRHTLTPLWGGLLTTPPPVARTTRFPRIGPIISLENPGQFARIETGGSSVVGRSPDRHTRRPSHQPRARPCAHLKQPAPGQQPPTNRTNSPTRRPPTRKNSILLTNSSPPPPAPPPSAFRSQLFVPLHRPSPQPGKSPVLLTKTGSPRHAPNATPQQPPTNEPNSPTRRPPTRKNAILLTNSLANNKQRTASNYQPSPTRKNAILLTKTNSTPPASGRPHASASGLPACSASWRAPSWQHLPTTRIVA